MADIEKVKAALIDDTFKGGPPPKLPGKERDHTLYCSFCGKSQHEVKKLIAGPTVFICDECVVLCVDIIFQDASPEGLAEELGRLHGSDEERLNKARGLIAEEMRRHARYVPLIEALAEFEKDPIQSTVPDAL